MREQSSYHICLLLPMKKHCRLQELDRVLYFQGLLIYSVYQVFKVEGKKVIGLAYFVHFSFLSEAGQPVYYFFIAFNKGKVVNFFCL